MNLADQHEGQQEAGTTNSPLEVQQGARNTSEGVTQSPTHALAQPGEKVMGRQQGEEVDAMLKGLNQDVDRFNDVPMEQLGTEDALDKDEEEAQLAKRRRVQTSLKTWVLEFEKGKRVQWYSRKTKKRPQKTTCADLCEHEDLGQNSGKPGQNPNDDGQADTVCATLNQGRIEHEIEENQRDTELHEDEMEMGLWAESAEPEPPRRDPTTSLLWDNEEDEDDVDVQQGILTSLIPESLEGRVEEITRVNPLQQVVSRAKVVKLVRPKSVPFGPSDKALRFNNSERACQAYMLKFCNSSLIVDNGFPPNKLHHSYLTNVINRLGWHEFARQDWRPSSWELCREFMANIDPMKPMVTWVRGKEVSFSSDVINELFRIDHERLSRELEVGETCKNISKDKKERKRVEQSLCKDKKPVFKKAGRTTFAEASLLDYIQPWWMFFCSKLHPTAQTSELSANMFYPMVEAMGGKYLDIGFYISWNIMKRTFTDRTVVIGHPNLIRRLCERAGVDLSLLAMDIPMGPPIEIVEDEPDSEPIEFRLISSEVVVSDDESEGSEPQGSSTRATSSRAHTEQSSQGIPGPSKTRSRRTWSRAVSSPASLSQPVQQPHTIHPEVKQCLKRLGEQIDDHREQIDDLREAQKLTNEKLDKILELLMSRAQAPSSSQGRSKKITPRDQSGSTNSRKKRPGKKKVRFSK